MDHEETESVFTKTVRFRCDFPDCKDARDKRDYSATTMEEHMANHFISLRPHLKQYIHQYPCSCGQVFATQYHFTVHLYQFRADDHKPAQVRAQWCSQKFLDAQAHFHSRFYPLYVAYKPFPKKLKLYPGYPIPDRVINNDDTDDYDRSRRSATPGCNTPGSFNMSRNASPSPSRGGNSRAQSPYNGRVSTSISVQRRGERWVSDFQPTLDIRGLETPAKKTTTDSYDWRDARGSRDVNDSSNAISSYSARDSSNLNDSSSTRGTRQSRHSEYQEGRHENYSNNNQNKGDYSRTRRSPRKNYQPQESTYQPSPVPPPILSSILPPTTFSSTTLLPPPPASRPPEPVQQAPSSSSFLSKINTKKRKAPTPPNDTQDKLRPGTNPALSSCPMSSETLVKVSEQGKDKAEAIGLFLEKPNINANIEQQNETTEDLDSAQMFNDDADQQEILLRQNSRSSYMPLRSNTQRHSVPSANLTADDENKISNFRPKSGRPEKPKMVAHPPFMDVVPNQGSRDRRSRSRSATPSRRSRSRSASRGPSLRKSPVHLSASDRRQSRSFARHSLRNK